MMIRRLAPFAAPLITIALGAYACSEETADPKPSMGSSSDASVDGNGALEASAPNPSDANGVDASSIDGASARPSLDSLRNLDPMFRKHETATQADLDALGFAHDDFTTPADPFDNGPQPTEGQFRIQCQWSHFGYDDPIVRPGMPGAAHLHMFWGNTNANARTVSRTPSIPSDPNELMEHGGSTCQAFELNRSAYWIPAMLDGAASPRNVVVPHQIVIYYKSNPPTDVHPMPHGLQLLAGNVAAGGVTGANFMNRYELFWSCGENGNIQNEQASIPTTCAPGLHINATIRFPQCIAAAPNGDPVLSSSDFVSHTLLIDDQDACPASHPYRVPQITYLVYWPNGTDGNGAGVTNWRLSSDKSTAGAVPGGSLHGDWLGGWNAGAIKKWTDGCFDPLKVGAGPRNCSEGQTGTDRSFRQMNVTNAYEGPNFFMQLPE